MMARSSGVHRLKRTKLIAIFSLHDNPDMGYRFWHTKIETTDGKYVVSLYRERQFSEAKKAAIAWDRKPHQGTYFVPELLKQYLVA